MSKLMIQREKVMKTLPPATVNSFPKSIAIRSNGYKNMKSGNGSRSGQDGKVRVSKSTLEFNCQSFPLLPSNSSGVRAKPLAARQKGGGKGSADPRLSAKSSNQRLLL